MPARERQKQVTDGDLEEHANRLARRVSARAPRAEEPEDDDAPSPGRSDLSEDEVEVDLSEGRRGADDEEGEEEGGDDDERPGRRERRRQRPVRFFEEAMRENQELRSQLAELRGRFEQAQQQQAQNLQQREPDPEDRELDEIDAAARVLEHEIAVARQAANGGALPQEQHDAFAARVRALDKRRVTAHVRQANRAERGNQPEPLTAQGAIVAQLVAEYPDVMGDDRMRTYADAYRNMQIVDGRNNDMSLLREAMQKTREKFGLAPKPRQPPSESRRDRYTGVTPGAGARESNGRKTMVLGKPQQRMAEAMYPNLKPAEAHKKWAQNQLARGRSRTAEE